MAGLVHLVGPTLQKYVHRCVPALKLLRMQLVSTRNRAALTAWSQVEGEAYEALFQQRTKDPRAFFEFAAKLRHRDDLPDELKASLKKDMAEQLVQQNAEKGKLLVVERHEPWPEDLKQQMLQDISEVFALLDGVQDEETKKEAFKLLIHLHREELFWIRYQTICIRGKMVSVCNGDLKEARSYAQHLAAVGLPQVDEEDLLIRAIGCARALAAAIKASEAACPGFSYHCQREVAVTLASDLADLGMARWKAHDEDQAQQYMSQALSALSDPQVVLDSFETSLFRSCAEKLHQVITETSACAVKAQASAPSLELAAAIDAFNNQHGELTELNV